MKTTKNFQEYIGKYVKFNMFGEHYAKITGFTKSEDAFFTEGPILQKTFRYDQKNNDFHKVTSILRVTEKHDIDTWCYFEEISEADYKNHLYELLKECSIAI